MMTRRTLNCVAALLVAPGVHAELVYQPPPDAGALSLDQQWRNSAAKLFQGSGALNEALAQLELRKTEDAAKRLSQAESLLKEAMQGYQTLARAIEKPRSVEVNKLSEEERRRLAQLQAMYGIEVPKNEIEAAKLAATETEKVLGILRTHRDQILKPDVRTVRDVIVSVNRLHLVGAQTAVLMQTVR